MSPRYVGYRFLGKFGGEDWLSLLSQDSVSIIDCQRLMKVEQIQKNLFIDFSYLSLVDLPKSKQFPEWVKVIHLHTRWKEKVLKP